LLHNVCTLMIEFVSGKFMFFIQLSYEHSAKIVELVVGAQTRYTYMSGS
jgi:hypothetical protein